MIPKEERDPPNELDIGIPGKPATWCGTVINMNCISTPMFSGSINNFRLSCWSKLFTLFHIRQKVMSWKNRGREKPSKYTRATMLISTFHSLWKSPSLSYKRECLALSNFLLLECLHFHFRCIFHLACIFIYGMS